MSSKVEKKRGFVAFGGDYILPEAIVRVLIVNDNEVSDASVKVFLHGGHTAQFDGAEAEQFRKWFLREKPVMSSGEK